MNTEKALRDEELLQEYQRGIDEGYELAESELLDIIQEQTQEIEDLKRQLYLMGGNV